MTLIVKCPTCGKLVAWSPAERFRPFCCDRCRLIDLGEWATESYAIPVAPAEDESAEPPLSREIL